MEAIAKILAALGIARPNRSLYSQFESSVGRLDRQVTDFKRKLTAANDAIKFLKEDDVPKAVDAALKGLKLGAVSAQMKKVEEAKAKGDLDSVLKAIPRRYLFTGIARAAGNIADDIPDLMSLSVNVVAEGAEVVTDRIPNSNAGGLTIAVTVASAQPLVTKSKNLKTNVEELKTQVEKLKVNVEEMRKKGEAMPEEAEAEG